MSYFDPESPVVHSRFWPSDGPNASIDAPSAGAFTNGLCFRLHKDGHVERYAAVEHAGKTWLAVPSEVHPAAGRKKPAVAAVTLENVNDSNDRTTPAALDMPVEARLHLAADFIGCHSAAGVIVSQAAIDALAGTGAEGQPLLKPVIPAGKLNPEPTPHECISFSQLAGSRMLEENVYCDEKGEQYSLSLGGFDAQNKTLLDISLKHRETGETKPVTDLPPPVLENMLGAADFTADMLGCQLGGTYQALLNAIDDNSLGTTAAGAGQDAGQSRGVYTVRPSGETVELDGHSYASATIHLIDAGGREHFQFGLIVDDELKFMRPLKVGIYTEQEKGSRHLKCQIIATGLYDFGADEPMDYSALPGTVRTMLADEWQKMLKNSPSSAFAPEALEAIAGQPVALQKQEQPQEAAGEYQFRAYSYLTLNPPQPVFEKHTVVEIEGEAYSLHLKDVDLEHDIVNGAQLVKQSDQSPVEWDQFSDNTRKNLAFVVHQVASLSSVEPSEALLYSIAGEAFARENTQIGHYRGSEMVEVDGHSYAVAFLDTIDSSGTQRYRPGLFIDQEFKMLNLEATDPQAEGASGTARVTGTQLLDQQTGEQVRYDTLPEEIRVELAAFLQQTVARSSNITIDSQALEAIAGRQLPPLEAEGHDADENEAITATSGFSFHSGENLFHEHTAIAIEGEKYRLLLSDVDVESHTVNGAVLIKEADQTQVGWETFDEDVRAGLVSISINAAGQYDVRLSETLIHAIAGKDNPHLDQLAQEHEHSHEHEGQDMTSPNALPGFSQAETVGQWIVGVIKDPANHPQLKNADHLVDVVAVGLRDNQNKNMYALVVDDTTGKDVESLRLVHIPSGKNFALSEEVAQYKGEVENIAPRIPRAARIRMAELLEKQAKEIGKNGLAPALKQRLIDGQDVSVSDKTVGETVHQATAKFAQKDIPAYLEERAQAAQDAGFAAYKAVMASDESDKKETNAKAAYHAAVAEFGGTPETLKQWAEESKSAGLASSRRPGSADRRAADEKDATVFDAEQNPTWAKREEGLARLRAENAERDKEGGGMAR